MVYNTHLPYDSGSTTSEQSSQYFTLGPANTLRCLLNPSMSYQHVKCDIQHAPMEDRSFTLRFRIGFVKQETK